MNLLPLALNVRGRRCVVFGAGAVARRKANSLLDCGARLTVVAPAFGEAWDAVECRKIERVYQQGDCAGALLVFACTDKAPVNLEIAEEARRLNILCNLSDDSQSGDFHSMAVVRRGDICLGISTNGGSPALARHLKEKIGETIGPEYESLLTLLAELRTVLPGALDDQSQRAAFWQAVLNSEILNLLRVGEAEGAEKLLENYLSQP